jgi:hypothetical protein
VEEVARRRRIAVTWKSGPLGPRTLKKSLGGGWPSLHCAPFFFSRNEKVGAPSLRFLQGWVAMPLIA